MHHDDSDNIRTRTDDGPDHNHADTPTTTQSDGLAGWPWAVTHPRLPRGVPHSGKRFVQQRVKAGASVLGLYPPGDDGRAACR